MPSKNHNKINCPTNSTSPRLFAVLLDAIAKKGTVTSVDAKEKIFPEARSAVSRYDSKNNDTHSEAMLKQYGLIEYVNNEETIFRVSHLGKRLLEVCAKDDTGCYIVQSGKYVIREDAEYSYNSVMVDCLMSWEDSSGECTISPGMLLLKLLSDKRLEEYITESDWAYTCAESDYRNNGDYEQLIDELVRFRASGEEITLSNEYVFLVAFSGNWQLLDRTTVDGKNRWTLKEITKKNLESKILKYDLLADSEYSILNTKDQEVEVTTRKSDKHVVSYWIKPFSIPDSLEVSEDMNGLQVDIECVDEQFIHSGDKVLFLNEQKNRLRLYNVFLINEMKKNDEIYDINLEKRQKVNKKKENEIIQQFNEEE